MRFGTFSGIMRALLVSIGAFVWACQPPVSPDPVTVGSSSVAPAKPSESMSTRADATVPTPPVVDTPPAPPATTTASISNTPAPRTGPVVDADDAVERAIPAANEALDKAYAKTSAPREPHNGPWVRADRAHIEGNAARGFVVRWWSNPPAGYAIEAIVQVSAKGDVRVVRATASYSPD